MCALEASKLPPNPDLEELLAQRGFARETVPALLLLPLVHVAWADGTLERLSRMKAKNEPSSP